MSNAIYDAGRKILLDNVPESLTAAPGRGMPDQLRDYWTHGEGALKIRWGTDGSFDRCVRLLRKYFPNDPQGLCAKLHKRATGEWPAEKGIQSHAGPVADLEELDEAYAFDPSQPRAVDGKWAGGAVKGKAQQDTEKKMGAAERGKALSDDEFVEMMVEAARLKPGEAGSERYRKLQARWDAAMKKDPGVMIKMMSRTRKARADAIKADKAKRASAPKKAAPAPPKKTTAKAALEADVADQFHLPGRHNQETHGNRVGKPNLPSKTGLGADVTRRFPKVNAAEESGHLDALRESIKRARDTEKARATEREAAPAAGQRVEDLSVPGAAGLKNIEKLLNRKGELHGGVPSVRNGGAGDGVVRNLERDGFITRDLEGTAGKPGTFREVVRITPKGRKALDDLAAGAKPGRGATRTAKAQLAVADLTEPGAAGLLNIEKLLGDREVLEIVGNLPTKAGGGVNESAIWNLIGKGFVTRKREPDPNSDEWLTEVRITPKGRAALAALKAGGIKADAGEDEGMSADVVTAHGGHDDPDAMDRALAYLDEPDEFAEGMLPRFTRWEGMLAPIGKPTGDRRIFEAGSLGNRDLPLPLLWQEMSDDGHKRSSVVGTIEQLDHREDGTYGVGRFLDPALFPDAEKAMALLKAKVNGPSVDLDDVTYGMKNADGTPFDVAAYEAETLAGGDPTKPLLSVSAGRISAATLVSIPAFAEVAHTWTLTDEVDEDGFSAALAGDMEECEDCFEGAALSAAGYVGPPLAAFLPRQFTGPTGPVITEDGQIYGHLAGWSTCHVGFQNVCVTPPHSAANYAFFHTGEVTTAEGERLAVGRLVLGAPHADLAMGYRASAQHYDNTGRVAALVRVYEDDHGIAFSGVMVHDLDERTRAEFAAMPLSGDWRRVGGNLELIGAISVPVPGFPVARALGAQPVALVAAGVIHSLDTQPVDAAPVTVGAGEQITLTISAQGGGAGVLDALRAALGDQQAAEVSGPGATEDFTERVALELAAVADTMDRERMALLDGINWGE